MPTAMMTNARMAEWRKKATNPISVSAIPATRTQRFSSLAACSGFFLVCPTWRAEKVSIFVRPRWFDLLPLIVFGGVLVTHSALGLTVRHNSTGRAQVQQAIDAESR